MAEELEQSPKSWTESQVSTWLRSIGVKEQYIEKLYEEEVDGQILLTLTEDFLKATICMKSGPAHLIIQKRDELINSKQKSQKKRKPISAKKTELEQKNINQKSVHCLPTTSEGPPAQTSERDEDASKERQTVQEQCVLTSKEDCRPRPFEEEGIDFIYVKHRVLQPESGAFNLITPCHEFKSFVIAATLERTRLQAKFAREVLKFATGCMNIRSNGTIHFGVMDSKEDAGYVHGEIIGFPVKEKDIYVDALDYIERSISSDKEHIRQCVRPPRFIEVMDRDSTEKKYVVEVDIVPSISIVKNKVYAVRVPNFNELTNKVEFEKQIIPRRVGAKTEPVSDKDQSDFYQRVKDRDAQREEAEKNQFLSAPELCQDLGRKLKMLMTSGKKFIEKEKWFILITNKFKPDDLSNIDWLLNMNMFCVFDFDPDSKISGLCSRYIQHHAANMHSLQSYRITGDMTIKEFTNQLYLFEQTSWIFCNGRTDFKGNETPCDEMTWFKTKLTFLRESVSLICKQILPKGTFQVIFLLTSPVEQPLLHTFNEFVSDMEGHDDIICICESQKNFQKWQSFAEGSCGTEPVNNSSVVGMKMSHINATLQQIQPVKCAGKHLPVFVKGTCLLETQVEEQMYSLEILTVDHCDETSEDFIDEEKANIEQQFYRGGRVNWLNFWLAERKYVGEVIKRDAYHDASKLLQDSLKWNADETPVNSINIYHHPGSGGSTVARQVLWNNRRDLRCAVVKPSYSVAVVAEHAVELREYEEENPQRCLPVLLLIEDPDKEYLDDLKNELEVAINTKRIQNGTPCFILLSCRRSYDPESKCKESPLQNVSVTHKLSAQEKRKFSGKREALQEQYEAEFILTFVLMSEGFNESYVKEFVEHLLQGINHGSVATRLILYVALLNTYVQNSFISQSHCEAMLALTIHLERFHQHEFEKSLSPQARLVFLHLRDDKRHIESIRIIHPVVAKEILLQLLGNQQTQSKLAMSLLCENVLFDHRFGREEYLSFLRALFIRRSRISKGYRYDSFFSPLIEHVCENERRPDKAIELLKEAFQRFHEDPFFAQQLARLYYTYEKFVEAKHWAETAAKQQPNNSYILDTKGQVYRKWFQAKCKAIDHDNVQRTAHNTADAVETALKALECFQECEKAAEADMENVNCSGFFSEVEVGCSLLKLIFSLDVFANRANGHSECMKYLLTDYIPKEVEDAWQPFHGHLKKLHKTVQEALEWISEDLSYFQTDISADDEETPERPEEKISHPLTWLAKKSSEYGKYFSEAYSTSLLQQGQSIPANLTPFQKRMIIYHLGGGNKLTDRRDAVNFLETILSFYPSNPKTAKFGQRDIVNYIVTNITLNGLSPQSLKVASVKDAVAPFLTKTVKAKKLCPWKNENTRLLKRWRKTNLTVHFEIYWDILKNYNNTIKLARRTYFSNLIINNKDKPRFLFSTFDLLTNTDFNKSSMAPSGALCEDFADHFRGKIDNIRSSLLPYQNVAFNTPGSVLLPEETLESFALVDARTLGRVFSQVNPTTCLLDPIPTSLLKTFEEQILNIVNCSLQTGVFPTAYKTAVVKPLLKKSNLDYSIFNNYRPVSNLLFLSKILEKLAFNRVNYFLKRNSILEKFQSGFRMNHSTETALVKILNDIRCNLDNHKLTVLVLLDLSAAFDTVDHHILLNRLKHLVGLSGTVFNWFNSYLTDRSFFVSTDTCSSRIHEIRCGVPQGSILGPLLFNLYMLPLGDVIRRHGISFHSYADDTQLYITVSPDDSGPLDALFNCILDIKSWMAENFLQLNQDKTEVLVIGPEGQREKLLPKLQDFKPSQSVKNLAVIFYPELTFIQHIKNITKIGFYHLKNIARVCPFLSQASTEVLMHAFISSRLDYCNALLSGLPKKSINNLQFLQNSATRMLTRTRGWEHITPVLKSLHWLPVRFRIDFKVLLLVFKCVNGLGPSYLSDLLLPYQPSQTLRSSGTGLFIVPRVKTKTHGEAAFSHYGPRLWNSLPENLRAAETVDIFKRRLKTHLFSLAFS